MRMVKPWPFFGLAGATTTRCERWRYVIRVLSLISYLFVIECGVHGHSHLYGGINNSVLSLSWPSFPVCSLFDGLKACPCSLPLDSKMESAFRVTWHLHNGLITRDDSLLNCLRRKYQKCSYAMSTSSRFLCCSLRQYPPIPAFLLQSTCHPMFEACDSPYYFHPKGYHGIDADHLKKSFTRRYREVGSFRPCLIRCSASLSEFGGITPKLMKNQILKSDHSIHVSDLTHVLDNGTVLLQNINFSVNKGDRIGLIGPNGSGKTTLLKLMEGSISPCRGSIRFGKRNMKISLLRQEFDESLDVKRTPYEEIASAFPEILNVMHRLSILERVATGEQPDKIQDNGISTDLTSKNERLKRYNKAVQYDAAAAGENSSLMEHNNYYPRKLLRSDKTISGTPKNALQSMLNTQEESRALQDNSHCLAFPPQSLLEEVFENQEIADSYDAYRFDTRIEKILDQLGISLESAKNKPLSMFSGGWKMRIALGRVFITEPDMILLDEPTNHLDKSMMKWLIDFLDQQKLPMVLVSHNGEFLNALCNKIIFLDSGRAVQYTGSYSEFLEEKNRLTNELYSNIYKNSITFSGESSNEKIVQGKSSHHHNAAASFSAFKKQQESLKRKTLIRRFDFVGSERGYLPNQLLSLNDLSHGTMGTTNGEGSESAFSGNAVMFFENINLKVQKGDRIAIVGANGSGKSVLLRLAAGLEKPLKGVVEFGNGVKNELVYFSQSASDFLDKNLTVYETMAKMQALEKAHKLESRCKGLRDHGNESFQGLQQKNNNSRMKRDDRLSRGEFSSSPPYYDANSASVTPALTQRIFELLAQFNFKGASVYKSVSSLSGGEKARLYLCSMLLKQASLLILDEPTNHLDMATKMAVESAILRHEGASIIVSHDDQFVKNIANLILVLEGKKLTVMCADDYFKGSLNKASSIERDNEDASSESIGGKGDASELNPIAKSTLDAEEINSRKDYFKLSSRMVGDDILFFDSNLAEGGNQDGDSMFYTNDSCKKKRLQKFGGKGRSGRIKGVKNLQRWGSKK